MLKLLSNLEFIMKSPELKASAPTPQELFEADVVQWEKDPNSVPMENEVHVHFERMDLLNCFEIGHEGLRMYNRLLQADGGGQAEDGSAIAAVFSGVAAASANGVFCALSRALGVSQRALEIVLEPYIDDGDVTRLGFQEFEKKVASEEAAYEAQQRASTPRRPRV